MEENPCCAALRRVKPVQVEGKTVGIAWLEPILAEVAARDLSSEEKIALELLQRVKIYNHVPRSLEKSYASAVYTEYRKYVRQNRTQNTKGGE